MGNVRRSKNPLPLGMGSVKGGYDRLINKLRAKFVNSKGINGIIREIKG